MLHMQHVQRYGKMLHSQMLKSATSDYDQRHVIAFRPISVAARSCSYDKYICFSTKFGAARKNFDCISL